MGWLNAPRNSVTAITFIVAMCFGSTQANAIAGDNNALRQNRPASPMHDQAAIDA
jgi:hypothetical protein